MANKGSNIFVHAFCAITMVACFAFFFWVTYLDSKGVKFGQDIAEIKICIIGIAGSIVGFVVGSSVGSRANATTIATIAKQQSPTDVIPKEQIPQP